MLENIRDTLTKNKNSPASDGYHKNIPRRIGEFVIKENKKHNIEYITTALDICSGHKSVSICILYKDGGWCVRKKFNERGVAYVLPSVNELDNLTGKHRALWHAKEYMLGRKMSGKERFSKIYQDCAVEPDIYEDDAFFTEWTEDEHPLAQRVQ